MYTQNGDCPCGFSIINGYTENWFVQNSFKINCRASDNNIGVMNGKYGVRV